MRRIDATLAVDESPDGGVELADAPIERVVALDDST
jgi:hypothetical protein